jgi:hypothetical protein
VGRRSKLSRYYNIREQFKEARRQEGIAVQLPKVKYGRKQPEN